MKTLFKKGSKSIPSVGEDGLLHHVVNVNNVTKVYKTSDITITVSF